MIAKEDPVYSTQQQTYKLDKKNKTRTISTPTIKGADIEIIEEVLKSLELKYKIEIVPTQNLKIMLQRGEADIALGIQKNKTSMQFADFPSTPLRTRNYFFYGLITGENPKSMTYEDVISHNYLVGILKGKNYSKEFWKVFPFEKGVLNNHLLEAEDEEQNIRRLKQKKIDLIIGDSDKTRMILSKLGADMLVFQYKNVLYWKDFYTAFSKNSKLKNFDDVKQKIKRAIYKMSESGEIKEINEKWTNTNK